MESVASARNLAQALLNVCKRLVNNRRGNVR
jgi:hypothetical protein